jgi:hypothetical protein
MLRHPPPGPAANQVSHKNSSVNQLFLKQEHELVEARIQNSWGYARNMAMYDRDYPGDDEGSLTEMMTEHNPTQLSRPDEATYQKNVSVTSCNFKGRTN